MRKDAVRLLGVRHQLLDAEVVDGEVEVQRGRHAHRAEVGGAVAAGAHVMQLAEGGDLAQVGHPARVDHRAADVVDELFLDELLAVPDAVEDLAHREGRGGVRADRPESLLQLGRDGVFHPEEAIRLEGLAEPGGLDRREPVVDVVEQVGLGAQLRAQSREEPGNEVQVALRAPPALRRQPLDGRLVRSTRASDAVCRLQARHRALRPHRLVALPQMK